MRVFLYRLGRFLQLVGLITPLLAITGNLASDMALGLSLTLSGVGIGIFVVGWMMQKAGAPR